MTETTSHPPAASPRHEADTEAETATRTEAEIETQAGAELAAANAYAAPDNAHLAFEHSVLESMQEEAKTTTVDAVKKSFSPISPFSQRDESRTESGEPAATKSFSPISPISHTSGGAGSGPELPDEALYGPVGELVRRLMPNTESDPAAIYVQLLVGLGNLIGPSPYFVADGAEHRANLFAVVCGVTSKARKGTSWKQAERVLKELDERWLARRVKGGTVSGEGVTQVFGDDGDKRLLLLEGEFAQVLQAMRREGNTVSVLLRQAWDGQRLAVLRRKEPIEVEGAHLSLLGHITMMELQRLLANVEMSNGMANRCLWIHAKRSKLLPEGGQAANIEDLLQHLRSAIQNARARGELRRDDGARARWHEIYTQLSEPPAGQLGEILSRGEAQVMRLALLLALLDKSQHIERPHLEAALLLWQYCEASAAYIFAEGSMSSKAVRIWEALTTGPLTRTQISALFSNHASVKEIDAALVELKPRVIVDRRGSHSAETFRRKA